MKKLEKAGKILLVLNVDLAPEDVFLRYKKDTVKKHYDTYKLKEKEKNRNFILKEVPISIIN